jgi:hypothetical protein
VLNGDSSVDVTTGAAPTNVSTVATETPYWLRTAGPFADTPEALKNGTTMTCLIFGIPFDTRILIFAPAD